MLGGGAVVTGWIGAGLEPPPPEQALSIIADAKTNRILNVRAPNVDLSLKRMRRSGPSNAAAKKISSFSLPVARPFDHICSQIRIDLLFFDM